MALQFHDKDDNELLQLFYDSGNNEWIGILLQRYTALLLGVSMKYLKNEEDAKDSVQQIFFKVLNELPKYKVTYFKSWLYMIAKNHCLMKLRDKGKYTVEITERNAPAENEKEEKVMAAEKETALNELEKAIEMLNSEQKICITQFYLEKKSYQQISDSTSFSVMQVKSNIQNGKRNLKIIMQRMMTNEQ